MKLAGVSLLFLYIMIAPAIALRVMTFNIWISGANVHDGMAKIARQITIVNPDVVALQEVESADVVANLTKLLGGPWIGAVHCNRTLPDTAILTRHTILDGSYTHTDYGMSVKIQLDKSGAKVTVWSLHLDYQSYGPYAAYNRLVSDEEQIIRGEFPLTTTGRVHNVLQLLTHPEFRRDVSKSNFVPLIVAGDFNCPSHLDWISANAAKHGGWKMQWPATRILADLTGLKDSFRELYPDPIISPGITWSTVNKFKEEWDYTIPEPTDRIDFIHYLGGLRPFESFPYSGNETMNPMPYHADNAYPSDHYAFVTDFEVLPRQSKVATVAAPRLHGRLHRRLRMATDQTREPTKMCSDNIYAARTFH